MTPEQIAQALNERKWRGRDDWAENGSYVSVAHHRADVYIDLHIEDARAIVQGWQAQDELAECQSRYRDIQRCADEANASVFTLQTRLASLTEDLARAEHIAQERLEQLQEQSVLFARSSNAEEYQRMEAQVVALTEENTALKADKERILGDFDATDEYADHLKAENERLRKSVEIATQIIGQCDCVFGDDGKLKRRWYESIFSAPAPLVEPPKTAKELDAAIDRFRAACGDVIPELERDEPEPDLDAILPCMDEGDSCVGGHGRHCPAFYRPAVARLCAERASAGAAQGTWQWALEQMKAGAKVVRPGDPRFRYVTMSTPLGLFNYGTDYAAFHSCHWDKDRWLRGGKLFAFEPNDFEATDWQLAPTEGEK